MLNTRKPRKCLSCLKVFSSEGSGNRRCQKCTGATEDQFMRRRSRAGYDGGAPAGLDATRIVTSLSGRVASFSPLDA